MLQERWPEPAGGRRCGWSRRSAGSEAFPEGVFARLQESSTSVVNRRGPSNDQVRNTIKKVFGARKGVLEVSLRIEKKRSPHRMGKAPFIVGKASACGRSRMIRRPHRSRLLDDDDRVADPCIQRCHPIYLEETFDHIK